MSNTLAVTKFNLGLLGEKIAGNFNLQGSLKQCENAICELQGSVKKRGGMKYLLPINKAGLLFPFVFNNKEAFVIIVTQNLLQIYSPKTNTITWSVATTLTPTEDDIFYISMYQVQDVVYICGPKFHPQKLIRLNKEGTNWSLNAVSFIEPPWLPENETDLKLTAGTACTDGTTPKGTSVTLTASTSVTEAQFPVGSWIRLLTVEGTSSYWATFIVSSVSGNTINTQYQSGTCKTNYSSVIWRQNAFINGNFPTCCCIHEARMSYCMGRYVFLSKVDSYDNFSLTPAVASEITVTDAMTTTLSMKQASSINWCASDRNLLVGTENEEYAIKSDDFGTLLSASSIRGQQQSTVGNEFLPVVQTSGGIIAVKKFGKKATFYSYDSESYRYGYKDLNLYNEDITEVGINDMTYTSDPVPILWLSLVDGTLVGCTLSIADDVVAFHKHNTQGQILSITSLPNDETGESELYLLIRRSEPGAENEEIYLEKLDNGVTASTKNTTNLFYSDSSIHLHSDIKKTHWEGAQHLHGRNVQVLADGAVQPECIVTEDGSIDIQYPANDLIVGLGYDMIVQAAELSVEGVVLENKAKNISSVDVLLYKTIGMWVGSENDKLKEIPTRSTSDKMDTALPLYTKMRKLLVEGGWKTSNNLIFGHRSPLPFQLLAIYLDLNVGK